MSEVEKLNAQIAKLQEERDSAMMRERDDVLAKIREQINLRFECAGVLPAYTFSNAGLLLQLDHEILLFA